MLILITLFYIVVDLQHLLFNSKTTSAHSSTINALKSLSDSSSLRTEFKMSLRRDQFHRGNAVFFLFISIVDTFALQQIRVTSKSKLGALYFPKFALI